MAGLVVLAATAGCVSGPARETSRFEFERAEMGLPFRLVLYAPDAAEAGRAADAAFGRIHELNGSLSDYDDTSELSRLSRSSGMGHWVPLGADLARVLRTADSISRESDGAFDVTVGPLVQVWKRARRQRELPSEAVLSSARASSGWTNLLLRRSGGGWEAELLRPGMRLDLGGIAKGYALDEAGVVLRAMGYPRFLISGGGDIVVGHPPPGSRGWRVQVGVFDAPHAPAPRSVLLRDEALATSGDTFQRAEIGGRRYSHIVDPRTGVGLTDHSLVTVIAPNGMQADALSKVISVLGAGEGWAIARRRDAQVFVMKMPDDRIEQWESPGFASFWDPDPGP